MIALLLDGAEGDARGAVRLPLMPRTAQSPAGPSVVALATMAAPPTLGTMSETITPRELAKQIGVSDRAIRQWLRDQGWQAVPYARWNLTADQIAQVRRHFGR